jgi:hypothetical protein
MDMGIATINEQTKFKKITGIATIKVTDLILKIFKAVIKATDLSLKSPWSR